MPKTLQQWLDYAETLHSKTIALGLERVAVVAEALGVKSFSCPVITVAGTNGKGSCVAFIEAIWQTAGYRVGAYTSPHLLRFNERVRVAGCEVGDQQLIEAFTQVEQARVDVALTYFELTTLVALYIFHQANVDGLVLEVGLGGRLDAVNIVEPDVAIITTIALDHTDWLGVDREAIGHEKAGIFRPFKSAICGDFSPPVSVVNAAKAQQAIFFSLNKNFSYQLDVADKWHWQCGEARYDQLPLPHLPVQNAATALMAIHCLQQRLPVAVEEIQAGIGTACVAGRFQQFNAPVNTILDVAHNPAAAELLVQQLIDKTHTGKTFAVVSMLADKDILNTLRPLVPLVDYWYVAGLSVPRGVTAEIMASHLQRLNVSAYQTEVSVVVAYQRVIKTCGPKDRVVVFGSFYTVAAILSEVTV